MRRVCRYVLMTMSIVLCFAATVFGQTDDWRDRRQGQDAQGDVVPGVTITVTGITVGFSRTIQSDSEGEFRVQQIPIGTYKVTTAARSGFAATQIDDVTVAIEKATLLNIKLGISSAPNRWLLRLMR